MRRLMIFILVIVIMLSGCTMFKTDVQKEDSINNAEKQETKVQTTSKVLEEAAALAESGEYVSAIQMIKKAQNEQGDNEDYSKEYSNYCNIFKADTIAKANELAENNDYLGAYSKLNDAMEIIGQDNELKSKALEYEQTFISKTIEETEIFINNSEFEKAEEKINSALKSFPNNSSLKQEAEKITNTRPMYLLDAVKPYKTGLDYEDNSIISMGGKDYSHGFTCVGYGQKPYRSATFFNLEGKYDKLSFVSGIVKDSVNDKVSVIIYTDGDPSYSFEMKMGDLPTEHTVDVSGCKQLIFSVYDERVAMYSGTYGFAEIIVDPAKQ